MLKGWLGMKTRAMFPAMAASLARSLIQLTTFVCMASGVQAQAASFDCAKAAIKVERAICENQDISKLDEKLAIAYQQALKTTSKKKDLMRQQYDWLVTVRNKCDDTNCLETAYTNRMAQMNLFEKKKENIFSGQWHLKICDKDISEECGGFTVYLIQTGSSICGDHYFATPGAGRLNEGSPRSIIGSVEGGRANIVITSGRNGAVFRVLVTANKDGLNWKKIEEIKPGPEGDSALVLEKGNLKREKEDKNYQETLISCLN